MEVAMQFMNLGNNSVFLHWVVQFLVVLFLVGSLVVLVTGVSLIVNSAATLRFFGVLNRWVSTRRLFRVLEIPHDTQRGVVRFRYLLGAVFFAGGAFAIYGLAARFNAHAVVTLLGLNFLRDDVALWLADSARWLLIAGNLVAVVAGVMLWFFPYKLVALETRGAHWYSDRKLAKGGDKMYLSLDNWVAAFPRAAGCIMTVIAVILTGAFGLMLPKV
jgi:hypothetical protein